MLRILVVPHQQRSAFRQPAEGALHDPTTSRMLDHAHPLRLVSSAGDVADVAPSLGHPPTGGRVIALVQAQVLGSIHSGRRSCHNDRVEGLSQQEIVVDIGRRDQDA